MRAIPPFEMRQRKPILITLPKERMQCTLFAERSRRVDCDEGSFTYLVQRLKACEANRWFWRLCYYQQMPDRNWSWGNNAVVIPEDRVETVLGSPPFFK